MTKHGGRNIAAASMSTDIFRTDESTKGTTPMISKLTGKRMKVGQHEFRVWNFPYNAGDTYTVEGTNNKYTVIAKGSPRNEGAGKVSVMVLIQEASK